MTEVLIPDTEEAVRSWARGHALLSPLLAGRVFFGFPAGAATLPLVVLTRVAGTTDEEAAVDYPRISFSVWGRNKKDAADTMRALVGALRSARGVQLDADTYCYDVTDIVTLWLPDDEAKLARYVVDCTFIVRA